jgi:hypothetical protein
MREILPERVTGAAKQWVSVLLAAVIPGVATAFSQVSFSKEPAPGERNPLNRQRVELVRDYTPASVEPGTTFSYNLPRRQRVVITVINVLGVVVKRLVNEVQDMGKHSVAIDGSDLPSGVYFCRMFTEEGRIQIRKITMVRKE